MYPAAAAAGLHAHHDVGVAHLERRAEPLVPALRDVAGKAARGRLVPVPREPGFELRAHEAGTSSRPARTRAASRKLANEGPRDGWGTRPSRSAAISSRIRSGETLSWFATLICTAGAKSHTPRHSSSCSVNRPSSLTSCPWVMPAAWCAASYTASAPRSLHARFVQTLTTCVP